MLMNLGEVVTAVKDRLATDTRTSTIVWHDGFRSPHMIQANPGGSVFVDSGEDIVAYIPGGRESKIDIVVWALERHENVGVAEKAIQGWLDKVLEVLTDNWNIRENPLASIDTISFRTSTHPEASPPESRFLITLHTTVHLH